MFDEKMNFNRNLKCFLSMKHDENRSIINTKLVVNLITYSLLLAKMRLSNHGNKQWI